MEVVFEKVKVPVDTMKQRLQSLREAADASQIITGDYVNSTGCRCLVGHLYAIEWIDSNESPDTTYKKRLAEDISIPGWFIGKSIRWNDYLFASLTDNKTHTYHRYADTLQQALEIAESNPDFWADAERAIEWRPDSMPAFGLWCRFVSTYLLKEESYV